MRTSEMTASCLTRDLSGSSLKRTRSMAWAASFHGPRHVFARAAVAGDLGGTIPRVPCRSWLLSQPARSIVRFARVEARFAGSGRPSAPNAPSGRRAGA